MLKYYIRVMLGKRSITGRKSILWVCATVIASFCVLSIVALSLGQKIVKADDTTYTTIINTNDSSLGKITLGSDCNGTLQDSYTGTTTVSWDNPSAYNRLAFPGGGQGPVTACPEDGMTFVGWYVNNTDVGETGTTLHQYFANSNSQAATLIESNTTNTITAIFQAPVVYNPYTVNIVPDNASHGTINIASGSDYTVTSGQAAGSYDISVAANIGNVTTGTVSISSSFDATVSPATGYFFTGFTSANNTQSNMVTTWTKTSNNADEYTLTLTGNDTVTANFMAYSDIIYTVSVNNPSVGAIDITGSDCASYTNQSFTKHLNPSIWYDDQNNPHLSYHNSVLDTNGNDIVACVTDSNYRFSHWLIDGVNVSSNTVLDDVGTWFKDGVNHTLQAVFVEDFYNVTFTTNNKGEIWMNNNKSYISLNPGNGIRVPTSGDSSLIATVDCDGDCSTARGTNSLMTNGYSGYRFHHFEISNNNAAVSTSSPSEGKYAFTLTGSATVTAIFGKYVNYEAGTIGGYTIDPVDPNNTTQVKVDEDAEGTVTGVTINVNSIPLGVVFDHWEDANGNNVSSSQTFVPSGSQLDNEPTYHPVFREVTINYTSGQANGTTIPAIDIISGETKTSESGLDPTGVTINQSLIPNGWVFVGWADSSDNIVAYGTNFIPTGNQIYDGATYHPVFQYSLTATFSTNDSTLGLLGYQGWGDKCTNGETLVSNVVMYEGSNDDVDFPYNEIYACPVGTAVFEGWSLDGGTTIVSSNQIANRWADYSWLNFTGGNSLSITAVFTSAPVYTVGVNDPDAGKIDALGGSCGDSTNTNVDWVSELIVNGNSKTLGSSTDPNITSDLLACPNTGYQFAYWLIDNSIQASTNTTLARTHSSWPSEPGNHSLRAVFSFPITYLDGIVDGDATKVVTTVDPADGATAKSSEQSTSITGATYSTTSLAQQSGAKFVGWEEVSSSCTVPNCPIVSTDDTFIPSGGQVYFGATYQPVFVTDNGYTEVLADDPDTGYISYWSNSQNQWIGRTDNGEFHVATVNGYVNGGIKATPRDGYVFDRWEYNGTTICTRTTAGCDEIVANEVAYQAASGNSISRLVAYFTPAAATYHVFTGYTGANGYFDHDLPETQRTGGVGAQAGRVTLSYYDGNDSDIPGAYADFSGDQHSTAPNGYYFAYWTTGCNTDYGYTELVTQNNGSQDIMNALGTETIVSFDQSFRPTRAQVQVCDEYIAVFYRKNQLRLIAQSENEAIGVVNATTTSTSEFYQELCDNTLMRVKANLGVGVNANGYYSSCDATAVVTAPAYKVSSWTFNGYTVLDATTHEPVTSLRYRGDYVVEDNGSYISLGNVIVGDGLNYLVAHFELLPLPFTGSGAIWLLVGGGIGLVAIPSVILWVGERKEPGKGKDKGGKK